MTVLRLTCGAQIDSRDPTRRDIHVVFGKGPVAQASQGNHDLWQKASLNSARGDS